jgi:hypothetical protein
MRVTHLLTPVVFSVIFSNLIFAQPQNPRIQQILGVEEPNHVLIAVSGRVVSITISFGDSEPNKYGLNAAEIKNIVVKKLTDNGFRIIERTPFTGTLPDLRINIGILKLESCGQCVISIGTFVSYVVHPLNMDEFYAFPADTWKIESGLLAVAINEAPAEINDIVQKQVQMFIAACPPTVAVEKKNDVNQPRPQLRKVTEDKDTKPVKQQAVEAAFVASKNSQVFHKASCSSAKRISPNNLVSYATRDEAIAAGKKPCERCNP